MSVININFALF